MELAGRLEQEAERGTPSAVHFTRGGPWFEQWQNVDYGDLWLQNAIWWKLVGSRPEAPAAIRRRA